MSCAFKQVFGSLFFLLLGTETGISGVCLIRRVENLLFGTYSFDATLDMVTTFRIRCRDLDDGDQVSYTVSLDQGLYGTFLDRQMEEPAGSSLSYNLYQDSGHSIIWGDGTGSTQVIANSYTATNSAHNDDYTVYGRIPAGETAPANSNYQDTIKITLDYTITDD